MSTQPTYYQTHRDSWYKKNICLVCSGSYSWSSRTNHLRTKKHQTVLERLQSESQLKLQVLYLQEQLNQLQRTTNQ